ncbi:MAG: hypothetical protein MRY77_00400 [Rhodobacteraceae bacterium]|nr:hypothetical protein [Paracoccaceae bacterium]
MTQFDLPVLSQDEIRDIQNRASQMRGEAMAKALRHLFLGLAHAPARLISVPTCARPLRS